MDGHSMDRVIRQQLFSTMETLQEANEILDNLLSAKTQELMALLADCQECAVAIGNEVEKFYKDAEVMRTFENYCEILYQIAITEEEEARRKVYHSAKDMLLLARKQMEQTFPVRQEIVFLPYKAAMWDSFESIWKRADADENVDTYVIPIPYFDKKEDGSFGMIHYEGELYPDYVPITQYNEYDFEKRKPDIIYIHNPYDDRNLVTSVHPFFYSKNLKRFTDKLVYIPYFILPEIDPADTYTISKMRHFCTTPGVQNADKVIVQSEAMKNIYVNVLTDCTGEDKRTYWENKIYGLGSPKIEKIQNTRKEELELPEEWKKIIQKPDGKLKKIIFYNTSVTTMLQKTEKMLQKMKEVFAFFNKKRTEFTLLWRPHPLLESTIASMRPELFKEYQSIKEQYLKEKWGIYDDTPDMDRAIILSDAYYGDESSVVELYKKTGKPVMFQNPEYKQSVGKRWFELRYAEKPASEVWSVVNLRNGFMELYIDIKQRRQGYYCGCIGDKRARIFRQWQVIGSKLYLAYSFNTGLYKYDLNTGESQYLRYFATKDSNSNRANYGNSTCAKGNFFFASWMEAGCIQIINTETGESVLKKITTSDASITLSVDMGKELWFLDDKGHLICCDVHGEVQSCIDIAKNRKPLKYVSYCDIGRNIWFFTDKKTDKVLKINKKSKRIIMLNRRCQAERVNTSKKIERWIFLRNIEKKTSAESLKAFVRAGNIKNEWRRILLENGQSVLPKLSREGLNVYTESIPEYVESGILLNLETFMDWIYMSDNGR